MNVRRSAVLLLLCAFLPLIATPSAQAAAFQPGNLVIYRVGDGSAALGSAATPVFLDEYTPSGAFVQTIALPTSLNGLNRRLTAAGSSTSEGFITRSGNNQYLFLAGYDAAPVITTSVATTTGTAVNRVIARVDVNGTIDTSTALSDFASGSNPRGAYSLDGISMWAVGGMGGVRYTSLGAVGSSIPVQTAVANLRTVQVVAGQLYVSSASGSTRIAAVGSGTPTTSGQSLSNFSGMPVTTTPAVPVSPYQFFLTDLDGTPGVDTIYIADDSTSANGGGIQKWCLIGGTWLRRGTATLATPRGITGFVSGTTVTLFAANGTNLVSITDTTGFDATFSGTPTTLGSAPTNTAFRGVAFAPVFTGNLPPSITPPGAINAVENSAPFDVSLNGSDDRGVYSWSASAVTGISSVNVTAGQTAATVTFTVTLATGFNGTARFAASLSDGVNAAVTQLVSIQVTPLAANLAPVITAPANPIAIVPQDAAPFAVNLTGSDDRGVYNWSASPGSGVDAVSVTGPNGTSNVTYTINLHPGFSGVASFTASLSDTVNPPATQLVNVSVTPAPLLDHVVISQIYGGGGNTSASYTNDYVELYNPTATAVDLSGWTLQYASATGSGWGTNRAPLGGMIGSHEYYLVKLASNEAVGAPLPPANIAGEINMSASSGKIALVRKGEGLSGGCPLTDPDLVDFVGYGSSADCREGLTPQNAPGTSNNTTAIFRKGNGSVDTNSNVNDFVIGATNPRRTAPITEIGPLVLSTDPISNGTNAPRDASITVTFTEPIDVDAGWFNITCPSGAHNDATVAGIGGTRVITPNVNFVPAEQCVVTILKDRVHDTDLDDTAPNTDTLPANYMWSFTVATGAAPLYPASVHLTMGNPSNATSDLRTADNYLMMKPEFALSYNRDLGRPDWVSWHLSNDWTGTLTRDDTFRPDPAVPSDWYRVQATDFFTTGFDRGHMTPNADRNNPNSIPINQATFLMSNMVAQAPDNNQGPWENLESYLRTLLPANEIYIISGPAGKGGTGSNGYAETVAGGHVTVPSSTWKVALILSKLDGDDVKRVTASTRTIAVNMPNIQGIKAIDWTTYLMSVDAVEQLTGYDLFSNVPAAIQNAIEAGVNGDNPPGVGDESVSTKEDTAKTFTLDVASPNNAPVTYTIVTAPLHGTLAGSDVTRTYTPAPDFNGTDTFTYRVSDATHPPSNTGTVTITVLEVNDPPTATDDSKSTDEDTPLSFAASELTANDTTGPANESTQTLTVTSVASTSDTHGTVTLNAAQVRYVPDTNYNGNASFTYTVCDDGVTSGLTDSQCAMATVLVAIAPMNDVPTAVDDSKSTDEDATLNFAASDLTANDSTGPPNENGQSLTVMSASATADTHGSVSLNGGQLTYVPDANYNGTASFTYRVCDNGSSRGALDAQCAVATVHLSVVPVNDPPTASIAIAATSPEGTAVTASVSVTDPDAAEEFSYAWSVTKNGAPYATAATTSFTFTPNDNGSYVVSVTVTDRAGATGGDSRTITMTNVAPVVTINGVPASASEGTPIALTSTVTDPGSADTFTYAWIVTRNGAPYAAGNTASFTFSPADNGNYVVVLTVTDDDGGSGTAPVSIAVTNIGPVITSSALSSATIDENGTVTLSGTFSDPGDDTHTVTINWGDGSPASPVTLTHGSRAFSFSHQYLDDAPSGTSSDVYAISLVVSDNDGGAANAASSVTVNNVAPVITSVSGPTAALALGSVASINVRYTDVGPLDTHSALFAWDDGSTSVATCAAGLCTASHTFAATGVYGVAITLSDDDNGVASAKFAYVIVTDANNAFVTGGGWITSATGKVSFSFNSKYLKNQPTPSGNVELQIQGANFNFHSTSMDWLVVAGSKAQFTGTGTVNGGGSYGYVLTAIDGDVDKFRIRIWEKTSGATSYDNVPGASDDIDDANPQAIGGGSIVIH